MATEKGSCRRCAGGWESFSAQERKVECGLRPAPFYAAGFLREVQSSASIQFAPYLNCELV